MSVKNSDSIDEVVGRRMRVRRLQLRLSQQTLGDALGVSYQQIQKYEKGISRIGAGRLQQLAEILKVPVSFFFDETFGGSQEPITLFAFLDNPYSLRLVQAFSNMADRPTQQRIVELVEQIAAIMTPAGPKLTALDRHIGGRVRNRRLELRLSESSVAEALKCTVDHLRAFEEGRTHMTAVLLFEISRVLEVEVSYFFDGPVNATLNQEYS
jgi:transcriptional regulator with XRE-family HTH domain